jgi:hypothetical protein
MTTVKSTEEQLADLNSQITLLQQQLALVNAQLTLDTARQTQDAQLAKALTDALKNQAAAQFDLESEKAKAPFAELVGIKNALTGLQLSGGKEGTVQVAQGTQGTALLRSKKPLLNLLDKVAEKLQTMSKGGVLVTEEQLNQAYQAFMMNERIDHQTESLTAARGRLGRTEGPPVLSLAPIVAGMYSVGLVLETVNSLAKFFRVDRKIDVFAADEEALQMLGYLLENKSKAGAVFVANPALFQAASLTETVTEVADRLNALLAAICQGEAVLAQFTPDQAKPYAAAPLKAEIEAARSLWESLDLGKKPEAFWSQIKGWHLWKMLKGKNRLLLAAKAQVLQITESGGMGGGGDVLKTTGEVQVAYRILDQAGDLLASGVILEASKTKSVSFSLLEDDSFPAPQ